MTLDRLNVVAAALAILMLLLPPWHKQFADGGEFLGYRPLLAGPTYGAVVALPKSEAPHEPPSETPARTGGLSRNPATGRLEWNPLAESVAKEPDFEFPRTQLVWKRGLVSWGVLITQWLVLGLIVSTVRLLRQKRETKS